uniref:Uncharacterized protein n=1 Tax=Hyaloperonospora arabidopsidis (strain Emoy2) TaxID=559515 RepID=M4BAW9_HYAAE
MMRRSPLNDAIQAKNQAHFCHHDNLVTSILQVESIIKGLLNGVENTLAQLSALQSFFCLVFQGDIDSSMFCIEEMVFLYIFLWLWNKEVVSLTFS